MKGIILAGGSGTRLYPITKAVSKQLIPIYDKPMIYYPLSVLMLAKIRDILIITTEEDQAAYKALLNDGSQIGLNIKYKIQHFPNGLAEAFILAEDFIGNSKCCLILGDNIFYNNELSTILQKTQLNDGATILGYPVRDPKRFGVVEFDNNNKVLSIEEKPLHPKSKFAILGLYFYDNSVVDKAKKVLPSKRGELEITNINQMYLEDNKLNLININRGMAWFDTGTSDSLLEASDFVRSIQKNKRQYIACIEEIAYRLGWIGKDYLIQVGNSLQKIDYGKYLLSIANE